MMTEIEWGAVIVMLGIAAWTDLRTMRIPNRLNVIFATMGLLYHGLAHGLEGLVMSSIGAVAGVLPLGLLYLLKGMGGVDVKLFGAFGIWAGAVLTVQLIVWSILFAGAIAMLILFMRLPSLNRLSAKIPWPWGKHPCTGARGLKFPFMLAVVPGFTSMWGFGLSGLF